MAKPIFKERWAERRVGSLRATPTFQQLAVFLVLVTGCSDAGGAVPAAEDGGAGAGSDTSSRLSFVDAAAFIDADAFIDAQAGEDAAPETGSDASSSSSIISKLNAALAEDPGKLSCARTFLDESASGREQAGQLVRTLVEAVGGVSVAQLTFASSLPCGVASTPCASRFEHDALAFGGALPRGLVGLVRELENTTSGGELTTWTSQGGSLAAVCVHAPIDRQLVGVCVIGGGPCAVRGP